MKRTICVVPSLALCALLAFFACSTPGEGDVGPTFLADSSAVLDFSSHRLGSVTLEEVVKSCQEATQFNFTYDESTQTALQEERVDLPRSRQIRVGEFTELMSRNGFSLHHIGPEHLHVVAIARH
jgi:hypothetical protein